MRSNELIEVAGQRGVVGHCLGDPAYSSVRVKTEHCAVLGAIDNLASAMSSMKHRAEGILKKLLAGAEREVAGVIREGDAVLKRELLALVDLDAVALFRDVVVGLGVVIGLESEAVAMFKIDPTYFVSVLVGMQELTLGEKAVTRKFWAALTAAKLSAPMPAIASGSRVEDVVLSASTIRVPFPVADALGAHLVVAALALSFKTASFVSNSSISAATFGSNSASISFSSAASRLVFRFELVVEVVAPLSPTKSQEALAIEVEAGLDDLTVAAVELGYGGAMLVAR